MKIRKFRNTDAEKCNKLIENIVDKSRNLNKRAKESIKRGSKPKVLIKKSKTRDYFICERDKKIIGIGGLKKNEVIRMYTLSKEQNKGIGSLILKRIEKEARGNKIKKLFLYTHPEASKFYLRNGFEIIKKFRDKGMNVIYMEKKLK